MITRVMIGRDKQLLFIVFALFFSFASNGANDELISEKRIGVAMRMIGHEVLNSLGDKQSRILPIEQSNDQYKIPFEFEFGFNPDEITSIIQAVMHKTQVASHYIAEVEHSESKEIVHAFEVGNPRSPNIIPCEGRPVPKDRYAILITILEKNQAAPLLKASTSNNSTNLGINNFVDT
ncbi:MAG: hypothetical protein AAFO07_31625, partial [Bacteroidota bacterium]